MINVDKILRRVDTLKPIAPIANQVMALADDPDSPMAELAGLIEHDAAMTANLLRMCNSAYFGLPTRIESVQQAVMLLGMNQVVELVLLDCLGENMKPAQEGYNLQAGQLWIQSIATALLAKSFAKKQQVDHTHRIFTAALLRDIGKVVLDNYVGDALDKLNDFVRKKGCSFEVAEREIIGLDHATLGAQIAEKWRFSPQMTFIIQNHHLGDPNARKDFETSVVYLADIVAMMVGVGIGADGLAYKYYEDVFWNLSLSEKALQGLMLEYLASRRKASTLLSDH